MIVGSDRRCNRRSVNSRTGQFADWSIRGLVKSTFDFKFAV